MNIHRSPPRHAALLACGLATLVACGSSDHVAPPDADGAIIDAGAGSVDAQSMEIAAAIDAQTDAPGTSDADAPSEAATNACTGVAPPATNGSPAAANDPRLLKAVTCASTTTGSDVAIDLEQTSLQSALFVATVTQRTPTALSGSFCAIGAWSGNFFNFADPSGTSTNVVFHLRARGLAAPTGDMPGDDNVQVHWSWISNTGDLNLADIHCVAQLN